MTRTRRAVLLGLAIVVVGIAFFALRDGSNDKSTSTQARTSATDTSTHSTQTTSTSGPLLTAGTIQNITVKKGAEVRFRVRSSKPDEVHIHGYDIKRDLKPGKTASIAFPATIEGIFEIELEQAGEQIAKLRVNP